MKYSHKLIVAFLSPLTFEGADEFSSFPQAFFLNFISFFFFFVSDSRIDYYVCSFSF